MAQLFNWPEVQNCTLARLSTFHRMNLRNGTSEQVPSDLPGYFECKSAGDLSIMFVGEPSDLPNFYTFVSEIRKHQWVEWTSNLRRSQVDV